MAKLILFSPYYKATDYKMGKYVRYIATREGVELPKNTKLNRPATKKQKDLIENMLKDFPNCNELLEYKDYIEKPTIENASEFITRVLEANVQSENMGGYVKYMATRPGAEKIAEHGLFSDNNKPIILSKVEQELNEYEGNVWTHIISLKREDAARLGFDNVQAWQNLLSAKRNEIAKNMNIDPENFKWYAAFHNESHHPHIHMVAYSTKPTEAYLSKKGIRNIKSCLAKEIFRNDLIQIYKEQTDIRDTLKASSKEIAENLIVNIMKGNFQNENIERLLFDLNDKLKQTSGKKVYGYLKPEVKLIVNQIVDELEKNENIKSLYALWYEQKDKITSNYTNEKLKRIPLSANKEFKSIRNMVIKEALKLGGFVLIFDDEFTEEPIKLSAPETELKLFFKWGIEFEKPFSLEEQQVREVKYLNKRELETAINELYGGEELSEEEIQAALAKAGQIHAPITEQEIEKNKTKKKNKGKASGGGQNMVKNNVPMARMNNVK